MAPPFPSLTKAWHTDSYPAISPLRPELSSAGKNVFITGGGTGIGASIARAFATAGCQKMAIVGRRLEPLKQTAAELEGNFSGLKVLVYSVDVTKKAQVDEAFASFVQEFGPVDVLVSNAGYVTNVGQVKDLDPEDAWTAFEIHVKGNIHVAQAFGRTAAETNAVAIHTSSIVTILPTYPGASAYTASKLAAEKMWEFFGTENPHVRVVSFQPGRIQTDMAVKIGVVGEDDVGLPGDFTVWLASPEASFLNGKFACANWDVEEMVARKAEFEQTALGTLKFNGFL